VRQTAVAIVSGANPIPPGAIREQIGAVGPRCGRGLATPRAGTFARAGNIKKGSDGNALCDAWRYPEMVRPKMRVAVRLKKPATGFPARALFFDFEIMQVFCPTGQELF
jgi:hypothetical protein